MFGPARRMRRRRTIVAGAAVGGAAYYAGKKGQQRAEREDDQEARLEDLEQGPAPAAPAAAPAADEGYIDELEQLSKLHEQGVLTDEEFDAKKKEILGI